MPIPPPDEPLHTALRRLGDHGVRAERFLDSAAKHLNDPGAGSLRSRLTPHLSGTSPTSNSVLTSAPRLPTA